MAYNILLKQAREALGLSQENLAEAVGAATQTISDWERGENYPSPYFRKKLASVLGKSPSELGLLPGSSLASSLYDPLIPLPTLLTGRQEDLTTVRQYILRSGTKCVVLLGLPGVGKTALAATLATDQKIRKQFSDGIFWIGLGPHRTRVPSLQRWGKLLGLAPTDLVDGSIQEAIRSAIGERSLLFIIDDAWNVEDVLFFLQVGGPHCAYLVTTRFPSVAFFLSVDGVIRIEELSLSDSMTLVRQLAPQVVDQEHKLEMLVQAVGGLPLALTIIANYLRAHAYSGPKRRMLNALERLSHTEERLHLRDLSLPLDASGQVEQTRSLYAVVALAEEYLSREAHHALRALATAFAAKPSGFTEEEALTVVSSVDLLDVLLDAGLLEWGSEDRYMIHQVVADYAKQSLSSPT